VHGHVSVVVVVVATNKKELRTRFWGRRRGMKTANLGMEKKRGTQRGYEKSATEETGD